MITPHRKSLVAAGCWTRPEHSGGSGERQRAREWIWLGIVYLWAADIGVATRDVDLDIDYSDTMDKLEMGFQGHMEAQETVSAGSWTSPSMAVGNNNDLPNVHLNSDLDMTAMDIAMVWNPGPERMTGFELYGGLRYIDTDFHLVVDPEPPALPTVETGVNTTYTDFLLGARYGMPLNEHWRLWLRRRPSEGESRGHLGPVCIRQLHDRAASLLRRLQACRNGPQGQHRRERQGDLFGTGNRLRFQLLRSDSKATEKQSKKPGFSGMISGLCRQAPGPLKRRLRLHQNQGAEGPRGRPQTARHVHRRHR